MAAEYLTDGPITQQMISHLMQRIRENDKCGGHSVFIGMVRADVIDGKKVVAIEYSAFEGMVRNEADKIRRMVLSEYDDVKIIEIVHSRGLVPSGEVSLFILVSSSHRHQAIQACAKTVELVKEKLPVWKKEIYDDESYVWKQNTPG